MKPEMRSCASLAVGFHGTPHPDQGEDGGDEDGGQEAHGLGSGAALILPGARLRGNHRARAAPGAGRAGVERPS